MFSEVDSQEIQEYVSQDLYQEPTQENQGLVTQDSYHAPTQEDLGLATQDLFDQTTQDDVGLVTQDMYQVPTHPDSLDLFPEVDSQEFLSQDHLFQVSTQENELRPVTQDSNQAGVQTITLDEDISPSIDNLENRDHNQTALDSELLANGTVMTFMSEVLAKVNTIEESIKKNTDAGKGQGDTAKTNELAPEHKNLLVQLKHCNGMDDLLENPLIKDAFRISGSSLVCVACEDVQHTNPGISFNDINYKQSSDVRMVGWFSDLKKKLRVHLKNVKHLELSAILECQQRKILPVKVRVIRGMRWLAYYLIKSNTAFDLWPTLLAVVNRAGLVVGNINHSRKFINGLLNYLNDLLIENTVKWFKAQKTLQSPSTSEPVLDWSCW